jgi:MFS family permease
MPQDPTTQAPQRLTADGWLLFATRCLRLFAYSLLSVILVLYLGKVGLSDGQIGLLLTLTLLGDTAISLWLTTTADRLGRGRPLMAGGRLMVFAAALFAWTDTFWLLLVAAYIGVLVFQIDPGTGEGDRGRWRLSGPGRADHRSESSSGRAGFRTSWPCWAR